uniref:Prostaglandin D2 receptor-like n=1 Tax=Crassostrea virginica TaxID=6565 RepID=A0A8B8D7X6_CRAVI|nr:prostaglandin D2 receptor-like [Crassostrea virginica]
MRRYVSQPAYAPFRYQQWMSPRRVIVVAVCLYLYAIFLATLPFMGVNKYGYQLWCDFHWSDTSPEGRFFVIIFLLQGFGCMLFTVFCNVSVIYELLAMRRRVGPGLNNATFKEKLEHFKFISIATIVSVAYIGCSTPYLVRLACNQFGYDLSLAKDFDAVRVYLVNNMTNSYFVLFLQALFHPKFVEKIRACCQRKSKENKKGTAGPHSQEEVKPK